MRVTSSTTKRHGRGIHVYGSMVIATRAIFATANGTAEGPSLGPMAAATKVTSLMISVMGGDSTYGPAWGSLRG